MFDFFMLLAETAPVTSTNPDQVVGTLERLTKGGVPLICLAIAVVAFVIAYWQTKLRLESEKERTELEKQYRQNIEEKAKQDKVDASQRLTDAKNDAEKRQDREMTLMKERLQSEKESDRILADAILVISNNIKFVEKVEKKLEQVEGVKQALTDILEKLRRIEDRVGDRR